VNGSAIEVLTQSGRSVRGQRVHRLKCDEVDEFSPEVWQAAQFVTQSGRGTDGVWIPAQMEVFSTMHRPLGPMAELVERISGSASLGEATSPERKRGDRSLTVAASQAKGATAPILLKWCLWEVIERCPPERSCSRCPLWSDCGGKARRAEGYFPIDDAIAQQARASRPAWETEMLCLRPRTDRLVFSEFDPERHVAAVAYDARLPLYRTLDFGYANPFVCLWVQVEDECGVRSAECEVNNSLAANVSERSANVSERSRGADVDLSAVRLRVLAEYVERERAIADHARAIIRCKTPRAGILEGIELVRRLLKTRPDGSAGLVIDPSCQWLIRALATYRWEETPEGARTERPAKDGADHPMDALRYLVTGLFLHRDRVRVRRW